MYGWVGYSYKILIKFFLEKKVISMKRLIVATLFFTPLVSMAVCIMPSPSASNDAGAAYRQCVDNEQKIEQMRQQQEQMRQQQELMIRQQEQRQQQEQMRQR